MRSHVLRGLLMLAALLLSLVGLTVTSPALAVTYGPEQTAWGTTVPTTTADPDPQAVTLGAQFQVTKPGIVKGVRFYKGTGNGGTHTGKLWSSTGTLLASVTFTGETASGWQRANFATPVTIQANTTYVIGYVARQGHYAAGTNLSSTNPRISGDVKETKGVYVYSTSGFPTLNYQNSHYYADVVFAAETTPAAPVAGFTSSATNLQASFTDTSTNTPTSWAWDFGDSTTSTVQSPSHTYAAAGTYNVTLTATNAGGSSSVTKSVTVTAGTVEQPPPPVTGSNCAPNPSACGYPDASNTGVTVPDGSLTTYNGGVDLTTNGQVFQNAIVNGHLAILANNVTVKNVRVINSGEDFGIGLGHTQNATITDSEVLSPAGQMRLVVGIKDIYGDATGTQILRTEITRTGTGIQTHEGLIADNYVHEMAMEPGDHINGTTSNGSTVPMTIRHNTILNAFAQTDAISLFQDFGCEANRTIENNLLAGGGYTVYGGDGGYCTSHDIVIRNNRFSRMYFPNSGYYGPLAHLDNGPGNAFTGNVWDDTGAALQ